MENHRVANGVSSGGPPNGMSPLSLIAVNGILTPSPTPSPDELVIRSRGRRQAPETWSPIAVRQAKTIPTPKKGSGTRMSPRKHLLLTDCKEHELTSTNAISAFAARMALLNGAKKKAKVSHHQESIPSTSIRSAAKALSHQQLVELLTTLITIHPELKPEVDTLMPEPDLSPMEEQLDYLKRNIFRSLPNSRLTSNTDSPAFNRVNIHLQTFKKCCMDQGRNLVESGQWNSVVEYVLMAWNYVQETPVWDNPPHNRVREHCFRALSSFLLQALKNGSWSQTFLSDLKQRIEGFREDSKEIGHCLTHLNSSAPSSDAVS